MFGKSAGYIPNAFPKHILQLLGCCGFQNFTVKAEISPPGVSKVLTSLPMLSAHCTALTLSFHLAPWGKNARVCDVPEVMSPSEAALPGPAQSVLAVEMPS